MIQKTLAALAIATLTLPAHALAVAGIPSSNPLTLVAAGLLTLLLAGRSSD